MHVSLFFSTSAYPIRSYHLAGFTSLARGMCWKSEFAMDFHVGDQVVHWSYGPGEIIQVDEKEISGHKSLYYVVQVKDLTLWVPIAQADTASLRYPTPASDFDSLFAIINSPGEPLSDNRLERKAQLSEMMRDGKLESICRVIRDLAYYSRTKKLSESDQVLLERAQNFLLNEWEISLSVSYTEAERDLKHMLQESHPKVK